jgi:hypothetical protein
MTFRDDDAPNILQQHRPTRSRPALRRCSSPKKC